MLIQCPHCSAKLQLGAPKPGRYQPKCKGCGTAFLIEITTDVPPRIRIGKPKTKSAVPSEPAASEPAASEPAASEPAASSASRTRTALDETVDQTVAQDSRSAAPSIPIAIGTNRPGDGSILAIHHAASGDERDDDVVALPERLGGYRIVRMLGRGAMGAVYHAKQLSLDRDVAIKTIRGRLAGNPASMARFTREAYAAAQLTHHNVVQIYDFGQDAGQHYFSMEWVRGGSLSDLVREKGSIDPKLAASYILQAARGLQFAHRNGMVHRDVKPANLLLGEDGVVKVADLGLVKFPDQVDPIPTDETSTSGRPQSGTQVTMQGTSVGTPAYMAPEQSEDASSVDHRADIYSLGCSLFYLLAGRSPYEGTVVSDVIEKHVSAPLPDLAEINARVPLALCSIVTRAMAKRPVDRYGSIAEMIDDLQSFLGLQPAMTFSPSSEQADRWESIAAAYTRTQTLQRWSGYILIGWSMICLAMALSLPFLMPAGILFAPSMLVASMLVALTLAAATHQSAVADHARRWFETLSWFELSVAAFASLVLAFVVVISGLWIGWLVGLLVGGIAGAAYHYMVTHASARSGGPSIADANRFIRDLRIQGADEDGLRDFIARYAGSHWQLVYEALFGFDALVQARGRLATDASFSGPTNAKSIRDQICAALARKTAENRNALDRQKLAKMEQQSLISQGISAAEAREQSWQMASAIMESAQVSFDQSAQDAKAIADAKRNRIKAMLADARSGRYKRPRDRFAALKFAFSGYSRLLAGCLLLAVFAFAAKSAGLFDEAMIENVRSGQIGFETLSGDVNTDALGRSTSLWSIGIAGLLLAMSAFVSGWRMTPFAIIATLIILFGALIGIPSVGPAKPWMVAAAIGLLVYLPGVIFGETKT